MHIQHCMSKWNHWLKHQCGRRYVIVCLCVSYTRYSQRTDCGSQYEIRVELLNQRKRPVQTFAPETVYLKQWDEEKWIQVWTELRSFIIMLMFTGGTKPKDNSRLTDIYFSDDPCIPELWTRSEIHPFYPRRQGHTVLGRMVWNSYYWQLCWNMSSNGPVTLWDSCNVSFAPFQVSFSLYNLQSCMYSVTSPIRHFQKTALVERWRAATWPH